MSVSFSSPVPWSLAWSEDGELALQDRFDLLQTLVATDCCEVQPGLISAIERLGLAQVTLQASSGLTGLCS